MQLFITPYILEDNDVVVITEERVVHQLHHVLRAKIGTVFFVQHFVTNAMLDALWQQQKTIERLQVSITHIDKKKIEAEIIDKKKNGIDNDTENKKEFFWNSQWKLFIALPNKIEKIELIIQKITELWLQNIYFFPSQYSQMKEPSKNKIERLWKIALEATEQSWSYVVPEIFFLENMDACFEKWEEKIFYFDVDAEKNLKNISENKNKKNIFFVWPEWWRWERDKKIFLEKNAQSISLWKNILRTETAAIVVAWELLK